MVPSGFRRVVIELCSLGLGVIYYIRLYATKQLLHSKVPLFLTEDRLYACCWKDCLCIFFSVTSNRNGSSAEDTAST